MYRYLSHICTKVPDSQVLPIPSGRESSGTGPKNSLFFFSLSFLKQTDDSTHLCQVWELNIQTTRVRGEGWKEARKDGALLKVNEQAEG